MLLGVKTGKKKKKKVHNMSINSKSITLTEFLWELAVVIKHFSNRQMQLSSVYCGAAFEQITHN